jgi:hypothetical protein
MTRRPSPRDFTRHLSQPAQFSAKLLDRQAQHPNCLMEAMPNLRPDGPQRRHFTL